MALDAAVNFAKSNVSAGYASGVTSIDLVASGGAKFPAAPFNATWYNATDYADPADDPSHEIVRVTVKSTDTLTITRAQEGTSDSNHNTGGKTYVLVAGPTAKLVTDLGSVTDDTTTNATMYPAWVTAAGNVLKYISTTKLTWNPSTGYLGVGTTAPVAQLTVSGNTTAALPAVAGVLHVAGANATNPIVVIDAYAGSPILAFSRADTTAASPSAVQVNENLGVFQGRGYKATVYSGNQAGFNMVAAETWDDTHCGTLLDFYTTPLASTTLTAVMRLSSAGALTMPVASPKITLAGATGVATATTFLGTGIPTYTTNATAVAGGLTAGAFFKVDVAGRYFVHVVV